MPRMREPKQRPSPPGLGLEAFLRSNRVPGIPCALSKFLDSRSPAEQAAITDAMMNPAVQASAIHRVLEGLGYEGAALTISVHRKRGCQTCRRQGRPWASGRG